MKFISHSADYPQVWTSVPNKWMDPYGGSDRLADWQNWETCGSRDAITAHGLLGALGEYFWPNQHTDPTVMVNDVIPCFYMNRSYQAPTTFINTATSVEANQNIAYTRQLLGGSCSEVVNPADSCRTPVPGCTTCVYTVPRQVINQIGALTPGQDLNLQAYVLVTGTSPAYTTNKDRWDCTKPDPAYHWSQRRGALLLCGLPADRHGDSEQPERRRDRSRRRGSGVGHDFTDEVIPGFRGP